MDFHAGTLNAQVLNRSSCLVRSRDLAIYLLTPGFTTAYHARALGISTTTIHKHLAWSRALALADPTITEAVDANCASITPSDGLKMAQRRGSAHLPWWSRLAMADFAARLESTSQVAALFRCSRRTVQLARTRGVLSYNVFTGERRLSAAQISPPGKWSAGRSSARSVAPVDLT